MSDTPTPDPLTPFLGQTVILDTQGPLIYIGQLTLVAYSTGLCLNPLKPA